MSRRDLILEEMGLGPLWRLRNAPGGEEARPEPGSRPAPQVQAAPPVLAAAPPTPAPVGGQPCPDIDASVDPAARREAILRMDWSALRQAVAGCSACPLHAGRDKTVFGVGDERAAWLFVGEGPGAEEDAQGEPFVGQAGRLLDNMLAALDMRRGDDVYIANVVKCRPPNNRNPQPAEMSCCEPFLARQIELIRPRLIVAMGKIAASHLLRTDASVASLRGRLHEYRGTPLVVTYHPAYLLRTLPDKAKAWTDLCFAREHMDAILGGQPNGQGSG